ncbi:Pentapeptide repeat-containing protein [Nocardioides exalbidus]|uniref:Pentapeptide repeat-containing protein n=1 Tax=Nocardioides exalbidus TaxID=402596 RepID=A0A1H4TBV5_9ACTN|nr:DinB family protein [Nocardioides exalbidus]SEC53768.1 Pentapeptide repeat-containing protein [Nocardioides exalbidus]
MTDTGQDFTEQDLSGSTFQRVDLSRSSFREVRLAGADVRDADLSDLRVRSAWLNGVRMTGVEVPDMEIHGEIGRLVVNGVDVAPLVEAELNRRMPERALMSPTDVAGFRLAFETLDRLWAGTVDQARALPPEQLHEQVDEEWSFIETLRHLGFAHACWVGGIVLTDPSPWHPLDLPWDEAPVVDGVPWDRDVSPSLDEVLDLRAQRRATVQAVLDDLADDGLSRHVVSATPFMTEATGLDVAQCLTVVLNEEWEHRLYAERDLARLRDAT